MKITVIVCNRDELTLYKSIMSIHKYIDEIILVDSSKLNIEPIVEKIKKNVVCDFKVFYTKPNIGKQLDKGISEASNPILFRWDSDFVGTKNINNIFDEIRSYVGDFAVKLPVNNLYGKNANYHYEYYCWVNRKRIRDKNRLHRKLVCLYKDMIHKPRPRFTFFPIPFTYNRYFIKKCEIIHYNQKLKYRDIERPYQIYWQLLTEDQQKSFGCFENYVKKNIEKGVKGFEWKFKKLPYEQ